MGEWGWILWSKVVVYIPPSDSGVAVYFLRPRGFRETVVVVYGEDILVHVYVVIGDHGESR
jgi:hypothetical protein